MRRIIRNDIHYAYLQYILFIMNMCAESPNIQMNVYFFTGRVIPERALLDTIEFSFQVPPQVDVPEGELFVQVIRSQLFARFVGEGDVANIFTLHNIVEDATRIVLDAVGFHLGYGYDLEIVQMVQADNNRKQVFGIDVPAVSKLCEEAGVTFSHIMFALSVQDGAYLRHALSDLREAIKSPKDTGFFCFRAVESLKSCFAARNGISSDKKAAWDEFRAAYGLDKDSILAIKSFADPVRHGNIAEIAPISDTDRSQLFVTAWRIVAQFIVTENHARPNPALELTARPSVS